MRERKVYMRLCKACALMIVINIFISVLAGCNAQPVVGKHYSEEDIEGILNLEEYISQPSISDVLTDKYSEEDFLFHNHCVSFYRDMDYFLYASLRYDELSLVIAEYPPQIVRTIENNGQKSMYFVYETDENTRLFVFFFESDRYRFTRGYPIIMKKSLYLENFSSLSVGDSMRRVEEIDPITPLYRQGYDTLSDELIKKTYIEGREKISSIHLLKDGIVRINYEKTSNGDYIISQIISSRDYTIPVIAGRLCYKIYDDDYVE